MQAIVDSDSSETLKFWWKVSSNENDDWLEFYIDDTLQSGCGIGELFAVQSGCWSLIMITGPPMVETG